MYRHNLNIDYICIIIALTILPILFLPNWAILNDKNCIIFGTVFLLILGLGYFYLKNIYRNYLCLIIIGSLSFLYANYYTIQYIIVQQQISEISSPLNTNITIKQILKQQSFQTAIAEVDLPEPVNKKVNIYINWNLEQPLKLGDIWQVQLKLKSISGRLNHGNFNRQKWLLSKHVVATANINQADKIRQSTNLRNRILEHNYELTTDIPMQGLLLALGFGERAWLDSEIYQLYQKTNTAHIIAISGLHIIIAFGLGFLLARMSQFLLAARYISELLPLGIGLIFALIYSWLAGFSIPTLRAIIAFTLLSIFHLMRYPTQSWQILIRVVAILLLMDPFMLLTNSFWLSVGAVSALILWYKVFPLSLIQYRGQPLSASPLRPIKYFIGLLHLQIGLLLFFIPIQIAIFGGISAASVLANLLIVPLFTIILIPLILFSICTNNFFLSYHLCDKLLILSNYSLDYLTGSWLQISQAQSFLVIIGLCLILMVALYLIYTKPRAKSANILFYRPLFNLNPNRQLAPKLIRCLYCTSIVGIISYASAYIVTSNYQPLWQAHFMDVGQGLAILIEKNKRAILYDTGPVWKESSIAKLELLPYIQRNGIKLDYIILSHDDLDHAGGMYDLLKAYPNIVVYSPSTKWDKLTRVKPCIANQEWQWQHLQFKVYSPNYISARAKNPETCVLTITDGVNKILFTGDAEQAQEFNFAPQIKPVDILQIGHHGSITSTSWSLLGHTKPKIGIISSGYKNRWNHPHPKVMQRLAQVNVKTYNTATDGQISIMFTQDNLKISTARHKNSAWFSYLEP